MSNHRAGSEMRRCVDGPRNGGPLRVVSCTPGPKKGTPQVGGRKKRSEMFLGSRAGQHEEGANLAGRVRGEKVRPLPQETVSRTQPDCAQYLVRPPVVLPGRVFSMAAWEPSEVEAMVPKMRRMAEWSPGAFVSGRVVFPADAAGRLRFFRQAGFREADAVALAGEVGEACGVARVGDSCRDAGATGEVAA